MDPDSQQETGHQDPGTTPLPGPAAARRILHHVLQCVLPEAALQRHLQLDPAAQTLIAAGRAYPLDRYPEILVVGGGKAAWRSGAGLVRILGDRINAGVLNVYRQQADRPISDRIRLYPADHPTPNLQGAAGARHMIRLLERAGPQTLVLALISGGGSSLMALPAGGISLDDYSALIRLLLSVPATIDEINAVRKHIDPLKGGGMRRLAARAGAFISLVLSDVPVSGTGRVDDPSVIASGPTVGDDSTFRSAYQALTRYAIWDRTPPAVRAHIQANLGRPENETLPLDSPLLDPARSQYLLIANNDQAMEAAGEMARQLHYHVHLLGCGSSATEERIRGTVDQALAWIWDRLTPQLAPGDRITWATFATDGVDGNSDLAGAVVDRDTLAQARERGLDYRDTLARYDTAAFFQQLGLGIETGPTGTNVADLCLVLIENPADPGRRLAFVFGGEATVHLRPPSGQPPGRGGRNTHLALLAAVKLAQELPAQEGPQALRPNPDRSTAHHGG